MKMSNTKKQDKIILLYRELNKEQRKEIKSILKYWDKVLD